jgi:hypothetical protein
MDTGIIALLGFAVVAAVVVLFAVLTNPYDIAEEEYEAAQKKRGRWWRLDQLLIRALRKKNPWDPQ